MIDGQEIKQQAIAKAKELEIDTMVRMIAKNGSCDGAGINYYADWEDMKIHATFGAGTNSASVQWRGKKLYHASNYGQHIVLPLAALGGIMIAFYTDGLLSKWGFHDGDLLGDIIFDVSEEMNVPAKNVDMHKCFYEVLKAHVIPKIKNRLDIEFIQTCHNPVRTRTLDGVEVDQFDLDWLENSGLKLEPEVVSVEESAVKQTIMDILAAEQSVAHDAGNLIITDSMDIEGFYRNILKVIS